MTETTICLCEGCEDVAQCCVYRVRYHGCREWDSEPCHYCDDCADLAAIDWSGDIAAIEPWEGER